MSYGAFERQWKNASSHFMACFESHVRAVAGFSPLAQTTECREGTKAVVADANDPLLPVPIQKSGR